MGNTPTSPSDIWPPERSPSEGSDTMTSSRVAETAVKAADGFAQKLAQCRENQGTLMSVKFQLSSLEREENELLNSDLELSSHGDIPDQEKKVIFAGTVLYSLIADM
jgi:hypothetical protein